MRNYIINIAQNCKISQELYAETKELDFNFKYMKHFNTIEDGIKRKDECC